MCCFSSTLYAPSNLRDGVMTFKTVFDAAHQGYAFDLSPLFGVPFILIGLMMVFRPALVPKRWIRVQSPLGRKIFSWFFLIFSVIWVTLAFKDANAERLLVSSKLVNGDYSVVEGRVTDFAPGPASGHGKESFSVQGHRFSYADPHLTAGFHQTSARGGPIKEGLLVRIAYSDNLILRLETAE
jgi:hypothetical protein